MLLSEIEVEALRDMLDDISEYVTDEMFTSPRGLGAFKRIQDKVEVLHKKTGRGQPPE